MPLPSPAPTATAVWLGCVRPVGYVRAAGAGYASPTVRAPNGKAVSGQTGSTSRRDPPRPMTVPCLDIGRGTWSSARPTPVRFWHPGGPHHGLHDVGAPARWLQAGAGRTSGGGRPAVCARDEAAILRVAVYRSPNLRSALGRAAGESTWSRFWAAMSSMLGVAWTAPAVSTFGGRSGSARSASI